MTFSAEDYEQAIARIYDPNGAVVGTGFLVAPGYVLTCAHVVLSAIGTEEEERFPEYQKPPQEPITLNFHILATGQPIQAEVVAWLPYQLESGDVAALKLRTPAPEAAKPIPLKALSWAAVAQDQHSVYGFGKSDGGGRTDAYRPKTSVAGGRFQLCKFGDPADETIQPGFSGAPVWNERLECVIGMIATAAVAKNVEQSTAQAIPTQALRKILNQIAAFHLHEVLQQSLEALDSNEERSRLERAISTTLQRCHPDAEDEPLQQQLLALLDLPPVTSWESEDRLIHWAVMLAWMDDTPQPTFNRLEAWVEQQQFKFSDLFVRITREMKQKQVPSSKVCEHLMVAVEPEETSNQWRVSMWAIADLATYNPNRPPLPIVHHETLVLRDLPSLIRKQIRANFQREPTPTIHLFVPRTLFSQGVEMLPSSRRAVLGSEYPCVLRTNLKTHPIDYYYYEDWHRKWAHLATDWETATATVFTSLDCQQEEKAIFTALESMSAAVLKNCEAVDQLFDLISEEVALPVALWSRDAQFQDNLSDILDCIVKTLPRRIHQERVSAHESTNPATLGHHLSLVWEDPRVVPPDMQFDPEAC